MLQQKQISLRELLSRIQHMSKFGEAIRERRELLGKDGPQLADESLALEQRDPVTFQRFSQQTFSRWEKDRNGSVISASNPRRLRSLAYLLQWSSEEMHTRVGVSPGYIPEFDTGPFSEYQADSQYVEIPLARPVPVYPAGTGPAWDLEEVLETLMLPVDLYRGKELLGLRAMSASMEPYLPEGAIAVIVHDDGMVEPGDFCGIRMADDGVVVKRFVRELEGGLLLLESLNPGPDEERLFTAPLGSRVIGKVVRRVLQD